MQLKLCRPLIHLLKKILLAHKCEIPEKNTHLYISVHSYFERIERVKNGNKTTEICQEFRLKNLLVKIWYEINGRPKKSKSTPWAVSIFLREFSKIPKKGLTGSFKSQTPSKNQSIYLNPGKTTLFPENNSLSIIRILN
jgi:hypothetical protein